MHSHAIEVRMPIDAIPTLGAMIPIEQSASRYRRNLRSRNECAERAFLPPLKSQARRYAVAANGADC